MQDQPVMQVKHKFRFVRGVFNNALLKRLTEKDLDQIKIQVFKDGESIYEKSFTIEVLPMDYFGGLQSYPQLLASYILSNNTSLYKIKADAIDILARNKLTPSFEGYQPYQFYARYLFHSLNL